MKSNAAQPPVSAYSYGLSLLSRCGYSTQNLILRLQRRGYQAEEIAAAVEKLTSYGFLDDDSLVKHYYHKYLAGKKSGLKLIRAKLSQKGFSTATIEACLANYDLTCEQERANELIKRRFTKKATVDLAKIGRYLAARGFTGEVIRRVLDDWRQSGE